MVYNMFLGVTKPRGSKWNTLTCSPHPFFLALLAHVAGFVVETRTTLATWK